MSPCHPISSDHWSSLELLGHLHPEGQALTNVVNGFDARCGFPQAAGAVDGTHIPTIRPQDNPTDYYNRTGYHSELMQAVWDHQKIFTDIYIG